MKISTIVAVVAVVGTGISGRQTAQAVEITYPTPDEVSAAIAGDSFDSLPAADTLWANEAPSGGIYDFMPQVVGVNFDCPAEAGARRLLPADFPLEFAFSMVSAELFTLLVFVCLLSLVLGAPPVYPREIHTPEQFVVILAFLKTAHLSV